MTISYVFMRCRAGAAIWLLTGMVCGAMILQARLRTPSAHEAPTGRGALRVVFANLAHDNPQPERAVDDLLALDADLLLLVETDRIDLVQQARLAEHYPHGSECRRDRCKLQVWSRLPAGGFDWKFRAADGSRYGPPLLQGEIRPRGAPPFRVAVVHLTRPYRAPADAMASLDALATVISAEGDPGTIMAGDLNNVAWSAGMRRFEGRLLPLRRLDDLEPTWPASLRWHGFDVPALLPIDHLYAGPQWRIVGRRTVPIAGSDHHARMFELLRYTGMNGMLAE